MDGHIFVTNIFSFTVQVVNGTNTTLRYDQRQPSLDDFVPQAVQFFIPSVLSMSLSPSIKSNETVPFMIQPEFQVLTSDGRLCENLGYDSPWYIEAFLNSSAGDPNARLQKSFNIPWRIIPKILT